MYFNPRVLTGMNAISNLSNLVPRKPFFFVDVYIYCLVEVQDFGENFIRNKFITRFRLGFSDLRKHKFKHSFRDTINLPCSCGLDIESTEQFLLHYRHFVNERCTLLGTIGNINYKLLENTDSVS